MEYPKRAESHIIETDSWKVLRSRTPKNWILREVTERDYGVDCYIELANEESQVTGRLLVGQLKGVSNLEWSQYGDFGKRFVTFSGIEKSTVNYWMGIPVPVFLFVADVGANKLYFSPVKEQIRERYNEYLTQKIFGFRLGDFTELGEKLGREIFNTYYYLESSFPRYESIILTILSHWASYFRFIEEHSFRDAPEGIEVSDEVMFAQLYQSCEYISGFFGIAWGLPALREIYRRDRHTLGDKYYRLHQWSFNKWLPEIKGALITIIDKMKERILQHQSSYWSHNHPIIYDSCRNLNVEQW